MRFLFSVLLSLTMVPAVIVLEIGNLLFSTNGKFIIVEKRK